MAELGFRTINEMIGRADSAGNRRGGRALEGRRHRPDADPRPGHASRTRTSTYCTSNRRTTASTGARQHELIELAGPALEDGEAGRSRTADRQHQPHGRHDSQPRGRQAVGRELACRTNTIHFKFTGSAGQSFGAFLANGITMELEGRRQRLRRQRPVRRPASSIRPKPQGSLRRGREHHHRQRRAVRRHRRQGLLPRPRRRAVLRAQLRCHAVIEGRRRPRLRIHDRRPGRDPRHRPGRNFAAGMSAAIAYVWDRGTTTSWPLQPRHGRTRKVEDARGHRRTVAGLIEEHLQYTGSTVGRAFCWTDWPASADEASSSRSCRSTTNAS